MSKTVLLVDDEQGFIEALADALKHEGHTVLTASTGEDAIRILESQRIDVVTVDIMMPPGASLEDSVSAHSTGLFLCEYIRKNHPRVGTFCISVVSDFAIIKRLRAMDVLFLRKGETPLRTVLNMIQSKLTGVAYSTNRKRTTTHEDR